MNDSSTKKSTAPSGTVVFCRRLQAALVESGTEVPRHGDVRVRLQDGHIVLVEVNKKIKPGVRAHMR